MRGAKPPSMYTLIVSDPKASSRYPWVHWLLVNVRGGDLSTGQAVYPYEGPTPPSGRHTYYFKLYEQPLGVIQAPATPGRGDFDSAAFIADNQLVEVASVHMFVAAKKIEAAPAT